ncbi:MAG: thioredoxin family protein [Armatimonadetes bacterium]|nr:thioredoxin family protein [Armatimonadota bacterium]
MKPFFLALALLVAPSLVLAQVAPPTAELVLDSKSVAVGDKITGTVVLTFGPGLHAWQNPPSEPEWMIPVSVKGDELTDVAYPKGKLLTVAGTEGLVYSGKVTIPVTFAGFADPGKYTFTIDVAYQQCDELACYAPENQALTASVTVSARSVVRPAPPVEEQPPAVAGNVPPTASIIGLDGTLGAGKQYQATVVLEFAEGLHGYQNPPSDENLIPVTVSGQSVVEVTYPKGEMMLAGGIEAAAYEGRVEILVVFQAPDEPGEHTLRLTVGYQQCNEFVCFLPDEFEVAAQMVVVKGEGEMVAFTSSTGGVATAPTPDGEGAVAGGGDQASAAAYGSGLEGFVNRMLATENWLFIVPAALVIGLLLCLTPCVFPMIPITVSFFSSQTSKNKGSTLMLGGMFALGIAATYGVVGGISAGAGGAIGDLFKQQWFMISLAVFLAALGLSMFGLYEIRLPAFIQRNLKGRSGPVGAVIMGLLMGFAAAPCAGALVGAVAVKVAEIGSIQVGIVMFSVIGLGMGLPFMALATVSTSAGNFLKSGGWLTTVKALIGFIVFYFAFDYLFKGIGFRGEELRTYAAWIAVLAAFAIYLFAFDKSGVSQAVMRIKGVAGLAIGVLAGMTFADYQDLKHKQEFERLMAEQGGQAALDGFVTQVSADGIDWISYNDENFQKAVAWNRPIMIDGRANWCVQCREIEKSVFETPEGLAALSNVVLMEIDWSTGVDKAYEKMTADRFNITGLPHIVFMEPGGENEFTVKDIKTVKELKEHLRRAGADL